MECSGRTQVSAPGFAERAPQRIDFGHGKVRTMTRQDFGAARRGVAGRASRSARRRSRPSWGRSRSSPRRATCRPAAFRKPCTAPSGAPTRGPFFSSLQVGLARGNAVHGAARAGAASRTRGALIDEAALDQRVGDELLQILGRLRLHARGDFLGEEFEQKIGHRLRNSAHPHLGGEGLGCGVSRIARRGRCRTVHTDPTRTASRKRSCRAPSARRRVGRLASASTDRCLLRFRSAAVPSAARTSRPVAPSQNGACGFAAGRRSTNGSHPSPRPRRRRARAPATTAGLAHRSLPLSSKLRPRRRLRLPATPRRRPSPDRARAGCSSAARSPRSRRAHRAG